MSQVNACLKRGFIIWTCLIGLLSGLTLGLTLFGHGYFHSTDGIDEMIVLINVMYAVTTATLLLAIMGMYGAAKDTSWLLIIFSVGMSLTILFVAFNLVAMLIFKNEAVELFVKEHRDLWTTPLDKANATNITGLYEMQENLRCCGVDKGYEDWGDHIHQTCVCREDVHECIPAPVNSSLYEGLTVGETVLIYIQPCLPVMKYYFNHMVNLLIAILASVVIFWAAPLLLAILILIQLRRTVEVPPVYYSAEAKVGNYACLAENGEME